MKWLIGALIFLTLAIAFQMSLLVFAMYVLLTLLVASRQIAKTWVTSLSATRECNRLTAEIGDTLAVIVTARNSGRLPIAWVLLEDLLPRGALVQRPPRLKVVGKRLRLTSISRQGEKSLRYQLEFLMRGYYQIGPLMMETGDMFGLHRRFVIGAKPSFVLVYPRVIPLEGYDLASRRPIGEARLTHRLYEDPTRISGVRLYQPGDPFQRVNWRATARTGRLHSKVYEPSTIVGATILLDFHREGYVAAHEPVRSELAITTAASLANAVYQLGEQVGLATNGRDAVDRVRREGFEGEFRHRATTKERATMRDENERLRPVVVETRRGPEQLRRIMETLARVEFTEGMRFASFVGEISDRLPRDATVVAVLSEVTIESAMALASLRKRGYAVVGTLVIYDDHEFRLAAGRLLTEGIEARQVKDEASLSALCRRQLVKS